MVEKAVIAGALYLLSILAGVWLSRRGRPLNMPLSVVHKLLSLGAAVFIALMIFGAPGLWGAGSAQTALSVCALALIAALIATGAILSGNKANTALKTVHIAAVVAEVACLAGMVIPW